MVSFVSLSLSLKLINDLTIIAPFLDSFLSGSLSVSESGSILITVLFDTDTDRLLNENLSSV